MSAYAVMGLIAGVATEGKIRMAILIMLAGLAVKTWIARHARW